VACLISESKPFKLQRQPYKVFQFGLGQVGALGMKSIFEPLSPQTHLGYLLKDSRFSISGVWDIDFNVRRKVSKLLEDKVKICQLENDFEADIVVISTPPQSHQEIISRVLKLGKVQLIVCEKPLSNNLAVAENIQKTLKQKKISCLVNFPRSIILSDNNWYSSIHKSLNQKKKIFCGIQIIDENDSGLWHAIHLLISIHKNFSKMELFGDKKFSSKDYVRLIGVYENLELEIKFVKTTKLVPRGEMHFFLPDQTIRVVDGFSKVFISKGERYLGWDKTSNSTILQVERIDNSMNSLYSKVYNNLIFGKIKSYGVDEAVLTHGLVEKINRFV
jgi:hypothetical protein